MDSKLKIKPVDYSVTNSPILNNYFSLFYLLEKAVFCFCFVVVVCLVVGFGLFVPPPPPHSFVVFVCFVLTKSMPVDGIACVSVGD